MSDNAWNVRRLEQGLLVNRAELFRLGTAILFIVLIMLVALARGPEGTGGILLVTAAMIGGYAEREDARLVVLHVVHDPAASPGFYHKPEAGWLRPMEDVAQEMFVEFLAGVRERNPEAVGLRRIETMVLVGLPAGRIAEAAEEIGAGLVVVGSRGRTGLPHIMLGSVAQRVAQMSAAPVTVVKAPETLEP